MTDDLIYQINDHFAHHMDSTIHKCEVKQREMRKKHSAPKVNGFTDDKIFELIDYYGGREAMRIMKRCREPERQPKRVDPLFCVSGKLRMLDEGSLTCTSCGKCQYMH